MAEDDPRKRNRRDPEPEIAAAEGLFQEDPVVKARRTAPKPAVAPGSETNEIFDLVEGPSADDPPPRDRPRRFRALPQRTQLANRERARRRRAPINHISIRRPWYRRSGRGMLNGGRH